MALFVLAGTAIYAGLSLILDPSGRSIGLSQDLINDLIFKDYLIPGIALLLMNGTSSFFILFLTVRKITGYGWFIMFQGVILASWLTVQLIMGIFDPLLHFSCYTISFLLILCGGVIYKKGQKKEKIAQNGQN